MAATEIVILSSSPVRPVGYGTVAMSFSPLPSPKALSRSRPQLRTGSRAQPIPANANCTFTSAASLLQNVISDEENINTLHDSAAVKIQALVETVEVSVMSKPVRKPRVIKAKDTGESTTLKKPRKPRARKDGNVAGTAVPDGDVESKNMPAVQEKAPRKPRAKKSDTEVQLKLPKGKVTKASAVGDKNAKAKTMVKKNPEIVSSHFNSITKESVNDANYSTDGPLHLPEAAKRRVNWTPPRPSADQPISLTPANNAGVAQEAPTELTNTPKVFSDLFGSFGYSKNSESEACVQIVDTGVTKKRKRLELVKTNASTLGEPEQAAVKIKAIKKKPRTITDLATAAYRTDDNEEKRSPAAAPLLQYFSSKNGDATTLETMTLEGFKLPLKPRNRSPVKSTKALKQKQKQTELQKLLSPQSALKQVEKQDFVFGTSSQLAREDSPTLLRDLHQAMLISNQLGNESCIDAFSTPLSETPKPCFIGGNGRVLYPAQRDLWSAASYGDMTNIETIDMTVTPKVSKDIAAQPKSVSLGGSYNRPASGPTTEDEEWHHLEGKSTDKSEVPPKDVGPVEAAIRLELLSGPVSGNIGSSNSPSRVKSLLVKNPKGTLKSSRKMPNTEKPDYNSHTTAQLAKEIASYRFKPVKSRDAMISLLEKCWEGRQRIALGALETNKSMSTSSVESQVKSKDADDAGIATMPKKSRLKKAGGGGPDSPKLTVGRPRSDGITKPKAGAKLEKLDSPSDNDIPLSSRQTPKKRTPKNLTTYLEDEISDSDSPLTPSPPRRRASKVGTPPKPLELVSDDGILSPTSKQLDLNKHITRAITTVPPSTDPTRPSWHEKMLLYDPIVLEDLTLWLNTGALQKVGWDGEVEPKEVKAWCLGKSVCCLWRENLRGGARSRY